MPDRPGCSDATARLLRNAPLAMLQTFNKSVSDEVRRVTVRKSPVHGRGVFALQAIPAGQRILEYYGLTINDAITPEILAHYSCRCGTKRCAGSMLTLAGG